MFLLGYVFVGLIGVINSIFFFINLIAIDNDNNFLDHLNQGR